MQKKAFELELAQGRMERAFERLEHLIALSPLIWLEKKIELCEQNGRPDEAREACRRILERLKKLPPHRQRSPRFAEMKKQAEEKLVQRPGGAR